MLKFIGTLKAGATIPADNLFISDSKFYYSKGTTLAGSMGVTSDEIGWGGDGSGVTSGAPELSGMPESPLDITPEKLLGFPF